MNREIVVCSLTRLNQLACWIALVLFTPLGWVAQQDEDDTSFKEALAKKLIAIETFEASFSQVAIAQSGETEVSQSGRLLFDRSGKFLWEVEKPFEQYILVTEDTMRVYDPDLEQLTISAFDAEMNASFASLILTSSTEILEDFDIEFEDDQYTLLPLKQGQNFVRLNIIFENDTLSSIEILDHFDTVNQFKFSDVATNMPLASDEFEFEVPDNTEVIDQRTNSRDNAADHDE